MELINLIYKLSELDEDTAKAVHDEFIRERGDSRAFEAVCELAAIFRKEKAAAGATAIPKQYARTV